MSAIEDDKPQSRENEMPRDGLVRAVFPGPVLRSPAPDDGFLGTMEVEFARYNEWTEINSVFEGNFMERVAPTAFDKTIKENQTSMRALFDHGADPSIGNKVLGPIRQIDQRASGPVGIVPLLDTSYNRDLEPGLKEGVYGASFRFRVMREDVDKEAARSQHNPKGLPERTITEAQVMEFGPVTFPAYAGASAGMRSLTDRFRGVDTTRDETPEEFVVAAEEDERSASGPDGQAPDVASPVVVPEPIETVAPPHPESPSRRGTQPEPSKPKEKRAMEELLARIDEISREHEEIAAENRNNLLDPDTQTRWDALVAEKDELVARVKAQRERDEYIARQRNIDGAIETPVRPSDYAGIAPRNKDKAPDNVFAVDEYHARASSQEHLGRLYTDGAKRAMESMRFGDTRAEPDRVREHMEHVLNHDTNREVALRVLQFGSELYQRAFGKYLAGAQLSTEEQRSLGIGSQGGQMPVPIQIDPTVTLVSNGVINPLRQIARNVTMTGYEWRGVSTTGVTAVYVAEGATSTDGSPTLVQPTIDAEQARCFVPFSFEVGMDWAGLEAELGGAIADAKDVLEATQFLTGAGHASNAPKGVLRSASTVIGTALNTNAGTVFAVGNIYDLETALPPRFRANGSFVLNKAVVQRIRQFDTSGGASLWNAYPAPLQTGMPSRLIGYPVYELSTMSTAAVSSSGGSWGLFGDFSKFIIADRVGMSIELIPQIFAGNTAGGISYPTGQRGLFAWWRNSSDVMSSNAFRAGTQS